MALTESLLRGCPPENQDGKFFPETRPLSHQLQENGSQVISLRRVVMEIEGGWLLGTGSKGLCLWDGGVTRGLW